MTTKRKFLVALSLAGALAFLAAGCKHHAPTTTPQAAPPPPAETTEAPPTPAPAPPAQPEGVMSEDLATMNAKGYMKDAFFDFNKSELREDARTALNADADWLKQYPSIQVLVEGHCDERGSEEYNLALGERRAAAVKDYLSNLGVDAGRIKTISYGKDRPFCTEHNETCWQENRRGHFVITAK